MYLRVAPELHLKKLIVGNIDKLFELNKNFRNEGVSNIHHPEFTSIEFYQINKSYIYFMEFTENLLKVLLFQLKGCSLFSYQNIYFDFSLLFNKITLLNSILLINTHLKLHNLFNTKFLMQSLYNLNYEIFYYQSIGQLQSLLFEKTVESYLVQPTFILNYPSSISPLSQRNKKNYFFADRFELYISSNEIANGFSELYKIKEQVTSFNDQFFIRNREHHGNNRYYDLSYIDALHHGMPIIVGEGLGIDRLVMLLTNSLFIKETLFFPFF
ncbi:UNVERIFIED_CONTAM: hypothetical protein GTU68_003300 [Idotea baltica]|nr:hypothetical protein [Idotea baltica]